MDLPDCKLESWDIYQTLCNSSSRYTQFIYLERGSFSQCLCSTLGVLFTDDFAIQSGSQGEGTGITTDDYGSQGEGTRITTDDYGSQGEGTGISTDDYGNMHSKSPGYISDLDIMQVLFYVRVIDEGDTLPQKFDKYTGLYCRAERGEHTTDGFRKLRVLIHRPESTLRKYRTLLLARIVNNSVEHGYMSSSTFMYTSAGQIGYDIRGPSIMQGPSDSNPEHDLVRCFYVKSWPKEAESWYTRQTHWPDKYLKSKIKKIGYLLVPIGNRNSQESDLEWRCSFSIAEKILFHSITTFQRCTFIMFKALLKEYLPSDINTDGEKQLLSTYHVKIVFLWCLEDRELKWEPRYMLNIIGHLFDKLLRWIHQQYIPHYFIPSANLLDGRQLYGRDNTLIGCISGIKNDLSNKIKQSQLFVGQKLCLCVLSKTVLDDLSRWRCFIHIYHYVMEDILGLVQKTMHRDVFEQVWFLNKFNLSHSMIIEVLRCIKQDVDPQMQHLYRAVYSDPVHDKLLIEVVPGLINQYRGCMHLVKYCMATRDHRILPDVLHEAESLLKDALHLDPCTGYFKLACLYIVTGDFYKALSKLFAAEKNFLRIHKRMNTLVEVDRISAERSGLVAHEVCQKWVEGQITSDIVVTWLEYITMPCVLQFELIHESTKHVTYYTNKLKDKPCKMVASEFHLQWPPLSMIKLLEFISTFNMIYTTSHVRRFVVDLVASSLYVTVFQNFNDIYTIFNMAAWCYVKIKEYKSAARMMTVAIGTSSQIKVMNRCAFSYHFTAYVLTQCLDSRGRVLVYKRDVTVQESINMAVPSTKNRDDDMFETVYGMDLNIKSVKGKCEN